MDDKTSLAELYQNYTARELAERFNCSHDSIRGKIQHLGLTKRRLDLWSDERVEKLKELHAAGLSCREIAAELGDGLTRSAIIGKLHRLGIRSTKTEKRPTVTYRKKEAQFRSKRTPNPNYVPPPPRLKITLNDIPKPGEQFKCTLAELSNDTCRWPLWGEDPNEQKFYCGAPEANCADGKSYCRWHTAIAGRKFEDEKETI